MKNFILFIIALLQVSISVAQEQHSCAEGKISRHLKLKKKSRAGLADNALMSKYDVHFYFLDMNAERNTTVISGATSIGALVTSPLLDTFCFELNPALTIDSIVYNNQTLTYTRTGPITYAQLPAAISQNTDFTVKIAYHGDASVTGAGAIGDGYSTGTSASWGNSATWSLSEPYSAYEWFPCKQFLQDKADSAWVFVTTSNQNKVGSNGILEGIDSLPNNKVRFRWKTHYVIDYYLISIAVAKYVDYTIYAHPAALPNDSIAIVNYIYDNPNTLPNFKNKLDSVALVMEYYSDILGLYPFYAEKYGHCMAPFGGGMEHQTMTSIGNPGSFSTNAHELMHQWFGDHVTCKTWKDIFINEGFASYGEYLAYDHFRGWPAAQAKMQNVHDDVLQDPTAMVYFTDTNNVGRIFDSRLTYNKGSAVIHTLRFVMGDSLFFQGLKDFQSAFAFSTAGIDDLKLSLQNTSGLNLNDYFNQWIYGEGYPIFSGEFYSNGSNLYLKITHSTSSTFTPLFKTPLEIKCFSPSGDTVVKVDLSLNSNTFIIPMSKNITNLEFDPNNWLLNTSGIINQNPDLVSLNLQDQQLSNATTIYPIPASDILHIKSLPNVYGQYKLRDLNGRVYSQRIASSDFSISLKNLASGIYLFELETSGAKVIRKVVKE
ncbi:MAG: T9SS type A sorting domain-containing protein [Chitinophagaceae bacterium]|nr:T9SS type A sorting domain-containing protein [Chitinophagaceae bacterium]